MKAGAQMVSQTYLFSFHHSPHGPTLRLKARLKLFFVICIWWLSLAKVVTLIAVRAEGKKRGLRRGEGRCREGRRSCF